MRIGLLDFIEVTQRLDLVAEPVSTAIKAVKLSNIYVTAIDPQLADTAAFCEQYKVGIDISANCVIVEAKQADKVWYAACVVLATTKADINSKVRRYLDARKISFAPMETAVTLTDMQYGGITPIGLPRGWPILIDQKVLKQPEVIVGSGIRGSKLAIATKTLAQLPNVVVMDITKE